MEENINCLVTGMQNCSLRDEASGEISKASGTSDAQNGKQFKQGSSKSNGKDSYQMQKTKQPGTNNKGNNKANCLIFDDSLRNLI